MKKCLALIIAMVFLLLAGCENVEYAQSTPESTVSTDLYEDLNSRLPMAEGEIKDQQFVIVTNDSAAFYQEESTAGSINRVLEERNTFLREKYGADVEVYEFTAEELTEELKSSLLTRQDFCDMISVSAEDTVKLYTAGLLMDMNTLPDFDLESGYFNKKQSRSLATNQSLYMLADPTALYYDEAYVMFYNRDVCPDPEGVESIESLVMQGKWTWDRFDEYQRLAAAEVYRKWGGDIETDLFAFGAYYLETIYPLTLWTSCGHKLVDNTYKNPVEISMESEDAITIAEYLMSVYNVVGKYPLEGEHARIAFEDNRLAFFCNKLSYIYALRDGTSMGSQYGFVPMPKYNEEQEEYHCLASNDARVISVPITVADDTEARRKFVSHVISATCAAGGETVNQAYVNSLLAVYMNTNEETVMLKTICDSVTFDFATVYGSGISEIATPTIKAIADYLDYGSGISSSLRRGQEAFAEYCNQHFNPVTEESENTQE